MSFWIWFEGGNSMPQRENWRQRLALWCGRQLGIRHKGVRIDPSARVSPEARIHPRGCQMSIGADTSIAANAIVQGNITIGDHCSVQTGSILVGFGSTEESEGRIHIGNRVRIAPFVQMIAANHIFADTERSIMEQGIEAHSITIEDDVWVAGRVIITAGVTIGRGSVIAAGAVVTKNVAPWSIMGGVPARLIRKRKTDESLPQ